MLLLSRVARFCSNAAARFEIPHNLVAVSYSRSSGSGGQNVNKVSTKVTLRLRMADAAPVLPEAIFARFCEQQRHRLTKDNDLVLHCDEERTQSRNQKLVFQRLQSFVDDATWEPAEFLKRQDTEVPPGIKNVRKLQKKQHAVKKSGRRKSFD